MDANRSAGEEPRPRAERCREVEEFAERVHGDTDETKTIIASSKIRVAQLIRASGIIGQMTDEERKRELRRLTEMADGFHQTRGPDD